MWGNGDFGCDQLTAKPINESPKAQIFEIIDQKLTLVDYVAGTREWSDLFDVLREANLLLGPGGMRFMMKEWLHMSKEI